MHVCKFAHKGVFVIVSGYMYWWLCVDLLSRVSRQDGYRGEVGAIERGEERREREREKDNMVRTSCTPRLPSHTE